MNPFHVMLRDLNERREEIEKRLVSSCRDWEEYKYYRGSLDSTVAAIELVKDAEARFIKDA